MRQLFFITSVVVLSIFLLLLSISPIEIFAQTQGRSLTPPVYPQCTTKMAAPGDRSSNAEGVHKISGKSDVEGRNEVYTLADGNFLQCTCEKGNDKGIATQWWYINGLPLGRVDKDVYIRDGWIEEDGRDWNLFTGQYLAKTNEFTCDAIQTAVVPTKTVTPTKRPSVTPTISRGGTSDITPTDISEETETLPETGISPFALLIVLLLGSTGLYLRRYYLVK